MGKKILTLDNLYEFFVQQNKAVNFSAKESGQPIVVSVPAMFETSEDNMPGMLKLKLKVNHIETNRNGSHISKENMEKAMPTLKYRPILAYIHELEDGTKDFYAHNIEIIENNDGEEEVVYLEKQVGCFTADQPWLEYDEEMDKTYVMAYAVIPEDYTETADIIRRKNGTKVSCELIIEELQYNAKEKYLDLIDFYYGGCTLLGSDEHGNEIGEGMLGSRADITDFCHKEPVFTYQDKLVEVLDKLNITLSNFNIKQSEEEGGNEEMNKFEELLAQYNKAAEDITFETEGLSDEELEAKFKEAFEETETEEVEVEEVEVVTEEEETAVENSSASEDGDAEDEKFELKYELSHDDIRMALYELLNARSEDGYYSSWIIEVFDSKFIYEDYSEYKFYRQNYVKDGDTIAFDGDPVEVFNEWLSKDEKDALDALKSNYAKLEEFKKNYESEQLKAQKDEIVAREEYAELSETDEFKALVADMDKYSVEELEIKCDLLFAAHAKAAFAVDNKDKKPVAMKFNVKTVDKTNDKPYGNLFDD